jgi:hypothetical protein
LIANVVALQKKYGSNGLRLIQDAVRALIAADRSKRLMTQLVDVPGTRQMKRYRCTAVSSTTNERENENAVDAVYGAVKPDYLVLLDGPDVVPHLHLNNLTPQGTDENVASDLPYAGD